MSTVGQPQDESASRKPRTRYRAPWWRAYAGLPTATRWRVVARRSRRPYTEVLGVVICLLDAASIAEDRGDISGFDPEACAVALDIETSDAEAIICALEETGWLAGKRIATWDDRQTAVAEDATAADRQRRKRERDRPASSVTPSHGAVTASHDREEETRSDVDQSIQEQNKILSPAEHERLRRRAGKFFDKEVWPAYPKSTKLPSRIPTRSKFIDLVFSGVDPEEILTGVQRYAETNPDPDFVKSPRNFLVDEDWNEGEPSCDREWDANDESVLYLPVGSKEDRIASAKAIMRAVTADSTPDGGRLFDRDFGKPPIGGYCLLAD